MACLTIALFLGRPFDPSESIANITFDVIRINDQWRICFKWSGGDAYDAEISDYHSEVI